LVLVIGVLCLSMLLISNKSYRDANHEIEELFDAQLAQTARLLQGMIGHDVEPEHQHNLQVALDKAFSPQSEAMDADDLRTGHPYESKMAFQLLDSRGQILLQSASAPGELLPKLLVTLPRTSNELTASNSLPAQLAGYHDVRVGQYHWRVFLLHDAPDQRWILVGERDDVRGELVGLIARRIMTPQIVGLPILALLIWLAIGWGLAPLAAMVSFIKSRAPDNLAPLLLAPLPQELEPMVAALNRLLQQVSHLLAREQRFLADAAHELRTPLAVLRIHAQNAQQAVDPADRANALLQLGNGVERATRVVTQLLTLARLEPSAVQLSMRTIDLAALTRQELAELTPLAFARQQDLELQTTGDNFQLLADSPSLETLLQNLISNALQYTPDGGHIRLCLEAQPDRLILRVQDSGPGVTPDLRDKLFERFFRQGMGQGAGLGLSIVQRVVELHGGSIELADSPLGGLEVQVSLPRQL
jgi:two-component system sensor histidine kinase QseC